ncbi:MAG: dihydropteroate synthase [Elusimicrobiota bacterium]
MAIVNVTPDSFYPASRSPDPGEAFERALRAEEEGADLLDVGGESTRPGSEPVAEEEECRRVLPVVERLAKRARVPVSVDTCRSGVAVRALDAGASVLNDVLALRGDASMPGVAARFQGVILMHMLGTSPRTMQESPCYGDVVGEISGFLRERISAFEAAGGDPGRVWLDPGVGFGKTLEHNLEILRRLEEFRSLGRPIILGASRKSFIGKLLGLADPAERLEGSLAAACRAAEAGVDMIRVHDVAATRRALEVWAGIERTPHG